jgi:hypothetical protein
MFSLRCLKDPPVKSGAWKRDVPVLANARRKQEREAHLNQERRNASAAAKFESEQFGDNFFRFFATPSS